jgi:hypothetical protein
VLCEQCDVGKSATVRGCTPEVNFFSEFTVRAGEKGHIGCHSFGPPCSRGVSKVWNYFGRKSDSAAIFLWMAIDFVPRGIRNVAHTGITPPTPQFELKSGVHSM